MGVEPFLSDVHLVHILHIILHMYDMYATHLNEKYVLLVNIWGFIVNLCTVHTYIP